MKYEIYLEELESFKEEIKVEVETDEIDTNIGTKEEVYEIATGRVSISIEDLNKEIKEALELMLDDQDNSLELEFIYNFTTESNWTYGINTKYTIENQRVYFELI